MTAIDAELEQPEPSDDAPDDGIAAYVDAVRSRLADLDPEEVDELTDDLHSHLAEIRAETDEPFEEIIGTPEQFAVELRQSAGLAPMSPSTGRLGPGSWTASAERVGRAARRRLTPVLEYRWIRATLDFLPELRPGWWVARGYLLAGFLALLTGGRLATFFAVPSIAGNSVLGFLVTAALIVASVRFGRRQIDAGWARAVAVVSAVLAAWVAVVLFDEVSSGAEVYYTAEDISAVPIDGPSSPFTSGPTPVNVYAVLPDGTPLDQVLLYDESGEPIVLPERGYSITLDSEFETRLAVDDSRRSVDNLYPRELLVPGWDDDTATFEYQLVPPPIIEWRTPIVPPDTTSPDTIDSDGP